MEQTPIVADVDPSVKANQGIREADTLTTLAAAGFVSTRIRDAGCDIS